MIACTATIHAKRRVRADYAAHETINSKKKASDKLKKMHLGSREAVFIVKPSDKCFNSC